MECKIFMTQCFQHRPSVCSQRYLRALRRWPSWSRCQSQPPTSDSCSRLLPVVLKLPFFAAIHPGLPRLLYIRYEMKPCNLSPLSPRLPWISALGLSPLAARRAICTVSIMVKFGPCKAPPSLNAASAAETNSTFFCSIFQVLQDDSQQPIPSFPEGGPSLGRL